jgi:Spy/CpxP family protein refolding chaperone
MYLPQPERNITPGKGNAMIASIRLAAPAAALLLTASLAVAGSHGGGQADTGKKSGKHAAHMVERLTKELELTTEQAAAVREIFAKRAEAHDGYKKDDAKKKEKKDGEAKRHGYGDRAMLPTHEAFIAQLRSGIVDTAALNRALTEDSERARKHHAARVQAFAEFHAVLTPEQRAKLADKMEERRTKMQERGDRERKRGERRERRAPGGY